MLPAVLAILVTAGAQSPAVDRRHAEDLARAGRTAEAIDLFERIVASNPNDVDARIGLAMALTRRGAWQEALAILREIERVAGENADAYGALARAYRRGGDDQHALEYFQRARALSPNDPDLVLGYEAVARTYGHWIALEGFGQTGGPGTSVAAGSIAAHGRLLRQLHLDALGRVQQGPDYSDAIGGGGFTWRLARPTILAFQVLGGAGNIALARTDVSIDLIHFLGPFEIGAGMRRLTFAGANVRAASPVFAWTPVDAWRVDGRYTYSRAAFDETGEAAGDHSVLLRTTWQAWRRIAWLGTYAYGIESFEDLTADRIGSLGATTVTGGIRIDLATLTRVTATWEHQWRSNSTTIDRLTVSVIQAIP